ncbi:MAG: ribF [Chlamydiales bacterium]|jgi:riboflavin kinase/FMN adenylyltransferase|nr:ribF [Chlamydiales bacterium]
MDRLYNYPPCTIAVSQPCVLTIGTFDGVHLGHRYLLKHISKNAAMSVVITFDPIPYSVLNSLSPIKPIISLEHRLDLLEELGIAKTIVLPFTQNLMQQSAELFLAEVQSKVPLSKLVLGFDSVLGKNKEGDPSLIYKIGKKLGFEVDYLDQYNLVEHEQMVSSSSIRANLQEGRLDLVESLLGRKFSIKGSPVVGRGLGKKIGFPTINLLVKGLSLPPYGVYAVTLLDQNRASYIGIANLGKAPSVRDLREDPFLEVHLLNANVPYDLKTVEVIFHVFLRAEKRFKSLLDLKKQIQNDIEQALILFKKIVTTNRSND